VRDVIPLQPVEQRQLDLRLLGDRQERNPLFFTPLAQSSAETLEHAASSANHET
jgi:hypothetical protein